MLRRFIKLFDTEDSGTTGGGAPQNTPAGTGAPAGGGAPQNTPAVPWLADADEATVGLVQNKGWKGPMDAVRAYEAAQKFVGVPTNELVRVPGEKATPQDWNAVYDRLGRPADAKGYDIKMPETGGDAKFADWARGTFHELGLTAAQGKAMAEKWEAFVGAGMAERNTATQARLQADTTALKNEWGAAYDKNSAVVDGACRALGMTEPQLVALRDTMGPAAAMKFLHNIGAKLGEDNFVTAEGGEKGAFANVMSPAQAQARIKELQADKEFVAKYLNGGADQKAEMSRLMAFAFPDQRQ